MEKLKINGKLPEGVNLDRLLENLTEKKPGLNLNRPFQAEVNLLVDGQIYNIRYSNPHHTLTVTQAECPGLVFDGKNWVVKSTTNERR